METQPFKALSMKQLEEAFAVAISSLTNLETKVTLSMIKQVDNELGRLSSKENYELSMSVAAGIWYGSRKTEPFPDDGVEIEL